MLSTHPREPRLGARWTPAASAKEMSAGHPSSEMIVSVVIRQSER